MVQRDRFTLEFQDQDALKRALYQLGSSQRRDGAPWLFLDSHQHEDPFGVFEALMGLGAAATFSINHCADGDWEQLKSWYSAQNDWCLGHLGYDLKNADEGLTSMNPDEVEFPDLHFFVPEKLFIVKKKHLEAFYLPTRAHEWTQDAAQLNEYLAALESSTLIETRCEDSEQGIVLEGRWTQEVYAQKFAEIQKHIQLGDIYETNFCQEFFHPNVSVDPAKLFQRLSQFSKAPFSAFYSLGTHSALCASPERYLTKRGRQLISQPIKGTLKRHQDLDVDQKALAEFIEDPKERRENIMITDLVRNDLSKVAARNSVQVKTLCKLESYQHVHQMVTTVTAELKDGLGPIDALSATFPMGSMTGVPKVRALQLMEHFEGHKRGLYSGAIGYFTPEGDFDFNVVIRSLLYNSSTRYLSLSVGGAITSSANAKDEYRECLLKAEALRQVLAKSKTTLA